jgi:WYL_2, Sm-like SH3 beta-barrel fold
MMMSEKNVKKDSQINTPEGREWLRGMLRVGEMTVTFEKLDGTTRKMLCTLAESEIPEEKRPKNSGKAQSDESIAVFDVEKQDWRSFRYDSVRQIQFSIGEQV